MRPIAAGHSDPMRGSKNACARAIMFMLDRCEQRGTVDNLRMVSCTALTGTIRAGNQQLRNANNFPANSDGTAVDVSKLRLKLVVHDVAQLYTSLPHDVVREALAWLTSTYKKTVRQKQAFIAVPIRGRQAKSQIHGGRSQNEATATTWSLESITALVDLSLEFSYLQLGVDHPLRQTVGIAMGCPASGALALTALAFMEHSSYQKIPAAMRPRLFGMRIMDDLARAVVYLVDDAQTEAEADRLLQATKYHDSLILEQTSDPAQPFTRYLEGELFVHEGGSLDCRFFNPNVVRLNPGVDSGAVSLSYELRCEKLRFRSWSSYGPPSVKRQVIYGFFRRMHGYGLDLERTQTEAGTQLVIELLHYNYPVQFLRSLIEQATDETICPLSKCSLLSLRELVEPTTTRRPCATPW